MTNLVLGMVRQHNVTDMFGYAGKTKDGRQLRCSTIFVRNGDDIPVGCLCVNVDVTQWQHVQELLVAQLGSVTDGSGTAPRDPVGRAARQSVETFPTDVESLGHELVQRAIDDTGVPVNLMHKRHKLRVIAVLDDGGFFLIKDSVEFAAHALAVSRHTIYNYRNELHRSGVGTRGLGEDIHGSN